AASCFYDNVAIRQAGFHAHSSALGVVVTAPAVMTAIDMIAHDHIVAIVHNHLRRNRSGADKHCPDGRSQNDHSQTSPLCLPRDRRNAGTAKMFPVLMSFDLFASVLTIRMDRQPLPLRWYRRTFS